MQKPKLYLIPTPVGNLEDITLRAVRLLGEVSLILAEDTRTTGVLLKHLEIKTPMRSYHAHNEHQIVNQLAEQIGAGQSVALVSDAGTPGISDPGFLLVRECIAKGIEVECLPGATAFVPALVQSGLPMERFSFEGFLPVKKGRKTRLEALAEQEKTMIFYESPFKLQKLLKDFISTFGHQRPAALSREISKLYHETLRGSLQELLEITEKRTLKGEMVLVVAGKNVENNKEELS